LPTTEILQTDILGSVAVSVILVPALLTTELLTRPIVAMDNLLENAVEHNDADEPRIDVGIDADGETVRLTVADNGPGIPDNQKESILYPESGETDGSGLSLVRTLVEGYDGSVRAEDNEPRGSRFVVELPRATAGGN
jgi:signal transduction histidine kinase